MLPYIDIPPIDLGLVTLQPFGILVATGVLFGAWIGRKRGQQLGVDEENVRVLTAYLLIPGFVGAHLVDVLFYQWDRLMGDPLLLVKVWIGISSYGGFLGAAVGFYLFVKRHRITQPLVYADITIWGLLPGFTFGRMGCATVHDHPGAKSDFFLAVNFPESALVDPKAGNILRPELYHSGGAGPRHDLGLYELLFLLGLIAVILVITRAGRSRPVGFVPGFAAACYGVVRFFLEFLRLDDSDPRTLGLTFAQYMSIATVLLGVAVLVYAYKIAPARREMAAAASEAASPATAAAGEKKKARKKGKRKAG